MNKNSLKKRKIRDLIKDLSAYLFSAFGILILVLICFFVVSQGWSTLNWKFLSSDYNSSKTTCSYQGEEASSALFEDPKIQGIYFSSKWGIGLEDSSDSQKEAAVMVSYMANNSPFKSLTNTADASYFKVAIGSFIDSCLFMTKEGQDIAFKKDGAQKMAESLDTATSIKSIVISTSGGGIRGSLISTLYLIVLTLAIGLPLGIGSAIYLSLYAKKGKTVEILTSLIDLASGIPSIIFGLVGALVFIPFVNSLTYAKGGSLISGALTLAVMLLPVIIRTTQEAIKTVPISFLEASLALGSSKSQGVFKVMLPNAIGGILTGVLLAIGRIIGESAALIYSVGTAIKDEIFLTEGSATLALHIWTLMSQESPNFQAASGIAIIIIVVDLALNLTIKVISYGLLRKYKGAN